MINNPMGVVSIELCEKGYISHPSHIKILIHLSHKKVSTASSFPLLYLNLLHTIILAESPHSLHFINNFIIAFNL